MSNLFDKYYKKYDTWYDKHRFAYLSELKAIKKVLPKKGKGLEVGVGTGRFAAPLGIEYGIDPSSKMLEIAKKRGVNVRLGRGENLPYRNSTFDYMVIIITLCFVKHPLKVLEETRRTLRKDGRVIIGMIDKDSFLGRFYQKKKSIFYKQASFFNVKEVSDLLKATNFGWINCYQTIFKLPEQINAIEKPKKNFGQGGFVVMSARKS